MDGDSTLVEVGADELRRIASPQARQVCANLRLASRIVGVAVASAALDDASVLRAMKRLMGRLAELREEVLAKTGVDKAAPEYETVFNVATALVLDVVVEEWKWQQMSGRERVLPPGIYGEMIDMVSTVWPARFAGNDESEFELSFVRRLAVCGITPKLAALTNFFDFFRSDLDDMVMKLGCAVVEQAERGVQRLAEKLPTVVQKMVVQRLYEVSAGLMCEAYKALVRRVVLRLENMAEVDRAVLLIQYDMQGGMPYDQVFDDHRDAITRMIEMADLLPQAQGRRR
jgi:DNA-binding phage protein